MVDSTKPFAFSQFVPGFDFLRNLTGGAAGGAVPGLSGLSSWVAPTLSVEELDKRINELKTVQYWLEQNVHALKATVQALEVQKMTLSTLQGMNVRMEDLANAFTRGTADAAEAMRQAADTRAPDAGAGDAPQAEGVTTGAAPAGAAGVVDTLQWWNALTQQFQQIASSALQDAAQLKMPGQPGGGEAEASAGKPRAAARRSPAGKAAKAARPAKPGGASASASSKVPAAARKSRVAAKR